MNKRHQTTTAIIFLLLGLFAIPISAQARQTRGHGYHMMGQGMMSQLTEQEQKTATEVMQKYHGPMMELRKQIFSKRAELNAVMAQETFDAKKARALGKEISAIETKMMNQHMEMFIEMREKGVSYYGSCMSGGMMMGPCTMGGGMGSGMDGRGMMMDNGKRKPGMMMNGMDNEMMDQNMMQPDKQ